MTEEQAAGGPPPRGHLIIVEPWVPEGQYKRVVRAVGPYAGHEPTWIFECSDPLGWNGVATNQLLLHPRGTSATWDANADGTIIVSGCLFATEPGAAYCGLIADYVPERP